MTLIDLSDRIYCQHDCWWCFLWCCDRPLLGMGQTHFHDFLEEHHYRASISIIYASPRVLFHRFVDLADFSNVTCYRKIHLVVRPFSSILISTPLIWTRDPRVLAWNFSSYRNIAWNLQHLEKFKPKIILDLEPKISSRFKT